MKSDLRVDWATHDAAGYACKNWHYSGCLPAGKLVKIGAWENGKFIGVVLFGRGANNRMSAAYKLSQDQACELVRVALTTHVTPVSRVMSIALRFLKKQSPGIRLLISYADPSEGHHGGIYQATNWLYAGPSRAQRDLVIGGVFTHKRSANSAYGTVSPEKIANITGKSVSWGPLEWKHTYLFPFDENMRASISHLAKPYPKRAKQAMTEDHSEQRRGSADLHAPALEA